MYLVRILNKKAKWALRDNCDANDHSSDAYVNVQTIDGKLSLFCADNDSDIMKIAIAYASTRDHLSYVDYCLLDHECLNRLSLQSIRTPGETCWDSVNEAHINLVNLSVDTLTKFLIYCLDCNIKISRISKVDIKSGLESALRNDDISLSCLKKSLVEKIS